MSSGRRFGIYGWSLTVNADDSEPSNRAWKAQLVRTDRNRETETETEQNGIDSVTMVITD